LQTFDASRPVTQAFPILLSEGWQHDARLANRRSGTSCVPALYSGIQTPKNQKPHALNPGSQTGFSW